MLTTMTSLIAGGGDCDVHPAVPHLTSLLPYLSDYWRDQVTTRGMVLPFPFGPGDCRSRWARCSGSP